MVDSGSKIQVCSFISTAVRCLGAQTPARCDLHIALREDMKMFWGKRWSSSK